MTDGIIREVRRVRHEISRRCGHDPRKVVTYYSEFQDELKRLGNYRFRDKSPEPDEERVDQVEEETPVRT